MYKIIIEPKFLYFYVKLLTWNTTRSFKIKIKGTDFRICSIICKQTFFWLKSVRKILVEHIQNSKKVQIFTLRSHIIKMIVCYHAVI